MPSSSHEAAQRPACLPAFLLASMVVLQDCPGSSAGFPWHLPTPSYSSPPAASHHRRHPQPPLPDLTCWSFVSPPRPSALQAFIPSIASWFVSFPVSALLPFTQYFMSSTLTLTVCTKPLCSPPDGRKILVYFADGRKQTSLHFKISHVFINLAALPTFL